MALTIKFEAETANDVATPDNIAGAIYRLENMTSQGILDIAAHLNIIGRSMRRTELTEGNVVAEEE